MIIDTGLPSSEVEKKIREFGYNEIPEKKANPYLRIAKKFWGITPWMLEATAALEWFLGKHLEMYVVLGLLVLNAILSLIEEERANAALSAVGIDLVLVSLIAVLGMPGITPIPAAAALTVLVASFLLVFLANDSFKVLLIRKLWPAA